MLYENDNMVIYLSKSECEVKRTPCAWVSCNAKGNGIPNCKECGAWKANSMSKDEAIKWWENKP